MTQDNVRLLLAAVVLLFASCKQGPEPRGLFDNLAPIRPVEARLIDLDWAPLGTRPGEGAQLRDLARQIRRKLAQERSLENLRAAGTLELLEGDFDSAVAYLEEGASMAPSDPKTLNDLAGAYLARAEHKSQPQDLLLALAAADKAAQAPNPLRTATCFNRSIALERLFLEAEAKKAWQECQALNKGSPWALEIRSRLSKLDRPSEASSWKEQKEILDQAVLSGRQVQLKEVLKRFAQPLREYVEEELIPRWAMALERGDPADANRYLKMAETIATDLADRGDFMALDSVRRISSSNPANRALVRSHIDYSKGLQAYRDRHYDEASALFQLAQAAWLQTASPFAEWAALQQARCVFQSSDYEKTIRHLDGLLGRVDRSRYPVLVARSLWVRGLSSLIQGRTTEALDAFAVAVSLFERLGERENLAAVHGLTSEAYELIGDVATAWQHRYEALSKARGQRDLSASYMVWEGGAITALRMSEPRAALYFQNELLRLARASNDPVALAGGLRGRAVIRTRLGNKDGALSDLVEAEGALLKIDDSDVKRTLQGDIRLVSGEAKLQANPVAAVLDLTEAVEIYKATGYGALLPQAYADRGRAHRRLKQDALAEADLETAVEIWEAGRQDLSDDLRRSAYFDRSRSLFDEAISFHASQARNEAAALDYAERGKGRALLDRLSALPPAASSEARTLGATFRPLRTQQIAKSLPSGMAVVEYWILDDRLLIWTLQHDHFNMTTVPVQARDLRRVVGGWLKAIRSGGGGRDTPEAHEVARHLWTPIADRIPAEARIVFVPDLFLTDLPFAALVDSASRDYLVRLHSVSVAPSATLYLEALGRDTKKSGESAGSLMVVGNPSFSRERFQDLEDISAAESEIRAIKSAYPDAELQLGSAATKANFLGKAGDFHMIHFAGHAIADLNSPLLSILVLAPDRKDRDSGALYAHEILGKSLGKTRLVFLSACGTARGSLSSSEGSMSFVRAFLASGVPTVIASLWKVDDEAAAAFSSTFYGRVRAGEDFLVALRKTQLEFLASEDDSLGIPSAWAAFELIGGS